MPDVSYRDDADDVDDDSTQPIYRGREQHGEWREAGVKLEAGEQGTGGGRF